MNQKLNFFFRIVFVTMGTAYLYVLMEWLYFVTKPSLLNVVGPFESFSYSTMIGLVSGLILTDFLIVFSIVPIGLDLLISLFLKRAVFLFSRLLLLIPAFALTSLAILLIKNYSYTMYGYIFRVEQFIFDYFYSSLAVFSLFIGTILYSLNQQVFSETKNILPLKVTTVLLAVITIVGGSYAFTTRNYAAETSLQAKDSISSLPETGTDAVAPTRPNIIFFSTDGLTAGSLGVYGGTRDETPYLRLFKKEAVQFYSNHADFSGTKGGLTAVQTGKSPLRTLLGFFPQQLTGKNSFENFPAILAAHGYANIEWTTRRYADSLDTGIINGYQMVNGRTANPLEGILPKDLFTQWSLPILFAYELNTRFFGVWRPLLKEVMQLEDSEEVVDDSEESAAWSVSDDKRLSDVIDWIKNSKKPIFAYLHLMGTHNGHFQIADKFLTKSEELLTEKEKKRASIFTLDNNFDNFVANLRQLEKLDNTILVFMTDHAHSVVPTEFSDQIPLLIRFPNAQFAGTNIYKGTQNSDLIPTILEYMGLPVPKWLDGVSFLPALKGELFSNRFIVGVSGFTRNTSKPPEENIKELSIYYCDQLWKSKYPFVSVYKSDKKFKYLDEYTSCDEKKTDEEALQALKEYLIEKNPVWEKIQKVNEESDYRELLSEFFKEPIKNKTCQLETKIPFMK